MGEKVLSWEIQRSLGDNPVQPSHVTGDEAEAQREWAIGPRPLNVVFNSLSITWPSCGSKSIHFFEQTLLTLLCSRHYSKCSTNINSPNPHNISKSWVVVVVVPFHRVSIWGMEKLGDLPRPHCTWVSTLLIHSVQHWDQGLFCSPHLWGHVTGIFVDGGQRS